MLGDSAGSPARMSFPGLAVMGPGHPAAHLSRPPRAVATLQESRSISCSKWAYPASGVEDPRERHLWHRKPMW